MMTTWQNGGGTATRGNKVITMAGTTMAGTTIASTTIASTTMASTIAGTAMADNGHRRA